MTKSPVIIGITDCNRFENYAKWFEEATENVEVIRLSWKDDSFRHIERCQAVVLSGGEDVHPDFYGKPEYLPMLDPAEITVARDEFEFKVLDEAVRRKLPVLGICRGLQVANVYFKGTLIPDIPTLGKPSHSRTQNRDRRHSVEVTPGTQLHAMVQSQRGEVNSAHHQSADEVSNLLKVNAISEDGIVEGLEWKDPEGKPFLMLVQWHPERMDDREESAFSKNIRHAFIHSIPQEIAVEPKA